MQELTKGVILNEERTVAPPGLPLLLCIFLNAVILLSNIFFSLGWAMSVPVILVNQESI